MRIAVNTRLLIPGKLDGIGWFTHETLKRITADHPEHEFIFIFDRKFSQEFIYGDNVKGVIAGPPARHPLLWYWWFEFTLPKVFNKIKPDLFLSQDGYISIKSKIPTVDVMHDINFEHFPHQLPNLIGKYYRKYFPVYAKKAHRIATVSEFSKADIVKTYNIQADKIDVVYNGVNENYRPFGDEIKSEIRLKYTDGNPFILFIGTIHERKNIVNMLKAFDAFKKSTNSKEEFLIVGRKMWWTKEMENTFNELDFKHDVKFMGRVHSTDELARVVSAASILLYVPVYEGFGVPVLEGQKSGVPVVTSGNSCLPEIAGKGAHFCDPFSITSIAEGIKKVLSDQEYRLKLIEEGKVNSAKYSWDDTANRLWKTIEQVLNA